MESFPNFFTPIHTVIEKEDLRLKKNYHQEIVHYWFEKAKEFLEAA